ERPTSRPHARGTMRSTPRRTPPRRRDRRRASRRTGSPSFALPFFRSRTAPGLLARDRRELAAGEAAAPEVRRRSVRDREVGRLAAVLERRRGREALLRAEVLEPALEAEVPALVRAVVVSAGVVVRARSAEGRLAPAERGDRPAGRRRVLARRGDAGGEV